MVKKLAEGTAWELWQKEGEIRLILQTPYGTIEMRALNPVGASDLREIERHYLFLKDQGPLETS